MPHGPYLRSQSPTRRVGSPPADPSRPLPRPSFRPATIPLSRDVGLEIHTLSTALIIREPRRPNPVVVWVVNPDEPAIHKPRPRHTQQLGGPDNRKRRLLRVDHFVRLLWCDVSDAKKAAAFLGTPDPSATRPPHAATVPTLPAHRHPPPAPFHPSGPSRPQPTGPATAHPHRSPARPRQSCDRCRSPRCAASRRYFTSACNSCALLPSLRPP